MVLYGDVFSALNDSGVRYVVVGGIAVVLRGCNRATVDLDVVIDLATEPTMTTLDALTRLGFQPRLPVPVAQFADAETRRRWVEERHLQVFSLYDPRNPMREVDLFAQHPIPFEELFASSSVVPVDGIDVRVASVSHLIAMKQIAGRPQDLVDIRELESLQRREAP